MKRLTSKVVALVIIIAMGWFVITSAYAASSKRSEDKEAKFPIGCTNVGYKDGLRVLTLYPGSAGPLQSMYFIYNKMNQNVVLHQMLGKDSEYSTRFTHGINAKNWAVLATGEPKVSFICSVGDRNGNYGTIIDCANAVKVCEYVNVKFGLNNRGNYWIVDSNTRNGAVNGVVHYGIIPGV